MLIDERARRRTVLGLKLQEIALLVAFVVAAVALVVVATIAPNELGQSKLPIILGVIGGALAGVTQTRP